MDRLPSICPAEACRQGSHRWSIRRPDIWSEASGTRSVMTPRKAERDVLGKLEDCLSPSTVRADRRDRGAWPGSWRASLGLDGLGAGGA